MKAGAKRMSTRTYFLTFSLMFVLGVYAITNLTSMLLRLLSVSLTTSEILVLTLSVVTLTFTVIVMGRLMYQVDKQQGRVRKKIKLFE